MSRYTKRSATSAVRSWLDAFAKYVPSNHHVIKERNFDFLATIQGMTENEMRVLTAMCAAANSLGWEQCRNARTKRMEWDASETSNVIYLKAGQS